MGLYVYKNSLKIPKLNYKFASAKKTTIKKIKVIGGPTASGKTALAITQALALGCPIISADSRQFYREMSIGTAKPSAEELAAVKHYFVDNLSINDEYNVGQYEREVLALLTELFEKFDTVVMVGGSGLFIKAVCEGLDSFPEVPEEVRKEARDLFVLHGISFLQEKLKNLDEEYYNEVDLQNPARLIRALEVCMATGKPYSSFRGKTPVQRAFTTEYEILNPPREELYDRINRRVDLMMEAGLLQEAESLYPYRELTPLQTVGYQEIFSYMEGHYTLEEAVEKIKQNTRNYAKRQVTWFKNSPRK